LSPISRIKAAFAITAIAFAILVFIPQVISGNRDPVFILFSLGVVVVSTPIFLFEILKHRMMSRKLRGISNELEVKEDEIVFKRPLTLEKGVFQAAGIWLAWNLMKEYRWDSKFAELEEAKTYTKIKLEDTVGNYITLLTEDSGGALVVPEYRVTDPEYENLVLFLVSNPSSLTIRLHKDRVVVRGDGNTAEMRLSVMNKKTLLGDVRRYMKSSGFSGIEVELNKQIREKKVFISLGKILVKSSSERSAFKFNIIPEKPTVIVTYEESISLKFLIRKMRYKPPLVAGVEPFVVKLILEAALRGEEYSGIAEIEIVPEIMKKERLF